MAALDDLIRAMQMQDQGIDPNGPSFRSIPLPDYAEEFPPAHDPDTLNTAMGGGGRGNKFLDALANAFYANPPAYTPNRNRPSGVEDFFGNLLQSGAQGFAVNRMGQMRERSAAQEQNRKNIELSQAARTLALRKQEARRDRLADIDATAAAQAKYREPKEPPKTLKQIQDEEAAKARGRKLGDPTSGLGRYGVGADDVEGEIASWANLISSGQATMQQVPFGARSAVAQYLRKNNVPIKPPKVRDNEASLAAAEAVISELESLLSMVGLAGSPVQRITTGGKNVAGAFTQSDPAAAQFNATRQSMLALIARASGERGVLTDQDVARAKQALPGLTDTQEMATSKLATLRSIFSQAKERTAKAYMSPSAPDSSDWFKVNAPGAK